MRPDWPPTSAFIALPFLSNLRSLTLHLGFNFRTDNRDADEVSEENLELINFRSLSALFLLTPVLQHFDVRGMLAGYSLLPTNLGQFWPNLQTTRTSPENDQSNYSGGLALGNHPLPKLRSLTLLDSRSANDLSQCLQQPRPHLQHLRFTVHDNNSAADWTAVFNLVSGLDTLKIRFETKLDPTSILQGLRHSSLALCLSFLRCNSIYLDSAFVPVTTWRSLLPSSLKLFTGQINLREFTTVAGYYAASLVEGEAESESAERIGRLILKELEDWARNSSTTIQLKVLKPCRYTTDGRYEEPSYGLPNRLIIRNGRLLAASPASASDHTFYVLSAL